MLSGFFGAALLLILLSAAGIVGARGADVAPSEISRTNAISSATWLSHPAAPAGTFARLTYQGRLTNSSGTPINSAVNMVFKFYDASNALLWTSATRSVTPVNGLFTVYLGDGSDPNLDNDILSSIATIGVKVGSDPELTPRQPLNSVVGHSNASSGVVGSSDSSLGVYGFSNTGYGVAGASNFVGVFGQTSDISGTGVLAVGADQSGIALLIANGGIRVSGAGIDEDTPVFVHVASVGNIVSTNQTIITHPLTDGDPDAILIITPANNYALAGGVNNPHPVGVYYANASPFKWVIYNTDGSAMPVGAQFNVLVVKP
jgi:hypothetical protein